MSKGISSYMIFQTNLKVVASFNRIYANQTQLPIFKIISETSVKNQELFLPPPSPNPNSIYLILCFQNQQNSLSCLRAVDSYYYRRRHCLFFEQTCFRSRLRVFFLRRVYWLDVAVIICLNEAGLSGETIRSRICGWITIGWNLFLKVLFILLDENNSSREMFTSCFYYY